jgi:hypothetical protein
VFRVSGSFISVPNPAGKAPASGKTSKKLSQRGDGKSKKSDTNPFVDEPSNHVRAQLGNKTLVETCADLIGGTRENAFNLSSVHSIKRRFCQLANH